jgi:toxin CcdB
MARFDVYQNPDGPGYLVDCQADLFRDYHVRVVVPLLPPDIAPKIVDRLNPTFQIDKEVYVMVPHFIASLPEAELGPRVTSLARQDMTIMAAIDMMLSGF